MRSLTALLVVAAVVPLPLCGQALASRISEVRSGTVVFHYQARAGVCGDGESFMRIGRSFHGRVSSLTRNAPCDFGPVQVQLTLRDGEVNRVDTWVGELHRQRDARDLGAVSSPEAARYLLGVARTATSKSTSSNAIMGAVLADSAKVWPSLLEIARDGTRRSSASRDDAMFWLSQFAASALNGRPNELFIDDDKDTEDADLKGQAVFVLSQLPNGSGNDELINVARHNKDPRVRAKALFWLGQSHDPRALDLFEEILSASRS